MPTDEPKFYSTEQVAKAFQLTPRSVRRMLSAGRLRGKKVGKAWIVPSAAIVRLLAEIYDGDDFSVEEVLRTMRTLRTGSAGS